MRHLALGVAAAALFGCNAGNGGVYLIQMPADAEQNCTTSVDHNFIDAEPYAPIEADTDWTVDISEDYSDGLFFVQMVKGKKGDRFLIIQGAVIPGVKEDGGYTFEWTRYEDVDEAYSYGPSPYTYREVAERSTTTRMRFDKGSEVNGFEGNLTLTSVVEAYYAESDEWDSSVPTNPQLNDVSPYYLVDTSGVGGGQYNWADEADCSGADCFIEVSENCGVGASFTATWTGYADEDAYDYLRVVQQAPGI